MSQWSFDHSRGDAETAAADVDQPVLVIGNTADDACAPSHTHRLFDAVARDRKLLHQVKGATHHYTGPGGESLPATSPRTARARRTMDTVGSICEKPGG